MSIAILDPACLFPEIRNYIPQASYCIYTPDINFTYPTAHSTLEQFIEIHGFPYTCDWTALNHLDTLCIVIPVHTMYSSPIWDYMRTQIRNILISNTFQSVIIVDTDTDTHDPSEINTQLRADKYCKIHSDPSVTYSKSVFLYKNDELYLRTQFGIYKKVTLFLTACNRPELLRATLTSFVAFNTYPIEEAIIMEDSGNIGINDFAHAILKCPLKILYASMRQGQKCSIENGLQYIKTPYVFHCEEDWEFYEYGFIEESMRILEKESKCSMVGLRAYSDISACYGFRVTPKDGYGICSDICFSWNPGLKTLKIAKMFAPYGRGNNDGVGEFDLMMAFLYSGYFYGMTLNANGYVRHIGWGAHVA